MRLRSRTMERGFTLPEFMIAITASAILVITGWSIWEISRRETVTSRSRAECSRLAFGVLQRIEQEVMRATTIRVPDPDHAGVASIELDIDNAGTIVKRAFRLEGDELIIDLKDEGGAFVSFDNVAGLGFTIQDPPTNSYVKIGCMVQVKGETVEMETVAKKRN